MARSRAIEEVCVVVWCLRKCSLGCCKVSGAATATGGESRACSARQRSQGAPRLPACPPARSRLRDHRSPQPFLSPHSSAKSYTFSDSFSTRSGHSHVFRVIFRNTQAFFSLSATCKHPSQYSPRQVLEPCRVLTTISQKLFSTEMMSQTTRHQQLAFVRP